MRHQNRNLHLFSYLAALAVQRAQNVIIHQRSASGSHPGGGRVLPLPGVPVEAAGGTVADNENPGLPVQTLLRQREKAERRNDVADVP